MSGPHPDPLSDMLSKPHELDGRFEREAKTVTTCISDAALTSIAVSLKRIADAMDGVLDEQALADLGMDSLDKLYLAVELETELGVEIDDEEIEGWFTVGDIVKTVERKV